MLYTVSKAVFPCESCVLFQKREIYSLKNCVLNFYADFPHFKKSSFFHFIG